MKALLTISVLVMHRDNVDICLDSGYNNYYIKWNAHRLLDELKAPQTDPIERPGDSA